MLNGHFKIGSHKEYSKGEGTGALSDNAEGSGGFSVKGPLINFTGMVGTITFNDCSFVAATTGSSFVLEDDVNSLMFCASQGDYDPVRHVAIIKGDSSRSYAPNPDLTAYLTLDSEKLQIALTAATDEFFGARTRWIGIPVSYGERHEIIDAKDFRGATSLELTKRLAKQASLKPIKFASEEEYRFLMCLIADTPLPDILLTNELTESVNEAFKLSIVSAGDIYAGAV
ncbi:hypothetical protein DEA98_13765 [Brucella pseudogrignonensis]|nr:hypothetical protein [Brucella pseudogrignonensis]